jgi:hypothetical protein
MNNIDGKSLEHPCYLAILYVDTNCQYMLLKNVTPKGDLAMCTFVFWTRFKGFGWDFSGFLDFDL